jgi:vacuolar-type H+-ATPase subunit H
VPVVTTLLDRLRRMQPPPGPAAGMLAVPSPGDELSGEVSFLFADLDNLGRERETLLAAARSDAAVAEQAAVRERSRLLTHAHEEGERRAARLLEEHRTRSRSRAHAMLASADRDAARVRARAQERMPSVLAEIVERLLKESP